MRSNQTTLISKSYQLSNSYITLVLKKSVILLVSIFILGLSLIIVGLRQATISYAITSPCNSSTLTTLRVKNGLLATVDSSIIGNFFINNLTPTPYCLTGSPAAIPQFALQSYDYLKSLYFSQATNVTPISIPANPASLPPMSTITPTSYLYNIQGDFTPNSDIFVPTGDTALVFIDGNLTLNYNITGTISSGIVLIVKGNVNIAPNVDNLGAFIFTYGNFCDSFVSNTCSPSNTAMLTVNGSVIAINPPPPTPPPAAPQFIRTYSLGTATAELIDYKAKYLVLFKNMLARDLYVWSEVQ